MLQVCLAIIVSLTVPEAEANLKSVMAKMRKCGRNTKCTQSAMVEMQAASTALKQAKADATAQASAAANGERDKHGGKSGGDDGQYYQFPDFDAVQRGLLDRQHCMHKQYDVLPRKAPPRPRAGMTPIDPPTCRMIPQRPTERYCHLNRVAVAWHVMHEWRDRYEQNDGFYDINMDSCFDWPTKAFAVSDDVGFRLAVLDFVGEALALGYERAREFARSALDKEADGPVKQRLEWLIAQ